MAAVVATRPLPPPQMLLLLGLTLLMGTAAGVPESETTPPPEPEGEVQPISSAVDESNFTVLVLAAAGGVVHQCSGSVLSERWVLTAAHCVNPSGNATEQVLVGVGRALGNMVAFAVDDVYIHGKFNVLHDDFDYNIALLKLSEALPLKKRGLRAVPLPDAATPPPHVGLRCVAAGWASRVLDVHMAAETKPELQSVDCFLETCDADRHLHGERNKNEGNTKICLSARDDCRTEILSSGDAGGPLVCDGVLAGVLSHARPARTGPGGGGGGWCVPRGPRAEGAWRPLAESAAQSMWALWGDVRALMWGRDSKNAWRLVSSRPADQPAQTGQPDQPGHFHKLAQSAQPVKPAQSAQSAQSAQPAHPVQHVRTAHHPHPPHYPLKQLHQRLVAALHR